ncbi:MAG: PAS domain S-box protein [Deltaproteobacteria bacterium]|nr:PAS domain S-box protein [Deltaproteobacteria bacterium]
MPQECGGLCANQQGKYRLSEKTTIPLVTEKIPGMISPNYLSRRLQWLMFLRVIFTTALLGSTIIVQLTDRQSIIAPPLLLVYAIIGIVYVVTFIYVLIFKRLGPNVRFAYVQISLDTFIVTLLIYVTGGIASVFSFLYLVVIVYASSMLLYKRGSFVMAALCSLQYGAMICLEYYGILEPFHTAGMGLQTHATSFVIYKIIITTIACFLVAFLSSHLAQLAIITENQLKAKQKDLQQLEAFNASIVHSMDSGLLTLNVEGTITSFNNAAEAITGYSRREVLEKPLADIFPEAAQYYTQSIESPPKRPYRQDITFKKRGGTVGYLGFSVSSLKEPDGKAIGHLLIFQDLSALKIMEAHIKRVEMLATVGEMAAGIAHEIKNPLASMTGSIQLLKEQITTTAVTEKLMHIVMREAHRLNGLVNDFLLFARPSSGKADPVELGSAIQETLDLFEKDALYQHTIEIVRNLKSDVWTRMDLKHMRQILWNLLLNAAEAIDGNGKIEVSTEESQDIIQVIVRDNGSGMSEEVQRSIFDPFFTTKSQGTGLGLSIVHRLLEPYNGQIEVKSNQGQGTSFTLYLEKIDPPG